MSGNKGKAILPGATLGVLGGGQLGRMFVTAARTMGYEVVVLDPDPGCPAGSMATQQIVAAYDDPKAWAQMAECCVAVTCEFENVPASALAWFAEQGIVVAPHADAVKVAQDRLLEKEQVRAAGFSVAPYTEVSVEHPPGEAKDKVAYPAILKSARLGYDGKGQVAVAEPDSLAQAWDELGQVDCVLEQRLDLAQELSVIVVRGRDGQAHSYPCIENRHRDGILDQSRVPAGTTPELEAQASRAALAIAEHLGYVGVLAVEFFVDASGALFVNEMAPRPHNSGHLSLNAAHCNQFEQQLRTLCNLALGPATWHCHSAMINLLGDLWSGGTPDFAALIAVPGCSVHLYGKSEARPGRKMGHITVTAPDQARLDASLIEVRRLLGLAVS